MKAVISVIGKDTVGILAKVSGKCMENNVNVIDVNQTVMQGMFAMTMLVDISGCSVSFTDFVTVMEKLGTEIGMSIKTMHEDVFNSMHKI